MDCYLAMLYMLFGHYSFLEAMLANIVHDIHFHHCRNVYRPWDRMYEVVVVAAVTAIVIYCCSYSSPCAKIPDITSIEAWSQQSSINLHDTERLRTLAGVSDWGEGQEMQCDILRTARAGVALSVYICTSQHGQLPKMPETYLRSGHELLRCNVCHRFSV